MPDQEPPHVTAALHLPQQAATCFDGIGGLVGGHTQQRRQDRLGGRPGFGLGGQQPRGRQIGLPPGADGLRAGEVPLAGVEHGRTGGKQGQDGERGGRRARQPNRPPVLADVLTDQLILGPLVHRRGQVRHRVAEAGVGQRQVLLCAGPAKVDVARLLAERPDQGTRQGGSPIPVEIAGCVVPDDLPVGHHHEEPGRRLVRAPVGRLLLHPRGAGRVRGGQQDEELRARQRRLDRRPQRRVGRQARLVAEHSQRPQPVPGLGEAVQGALQRRCEPAVDRVAVGDERRIDPGFRPVR